MAGRAPYLMCALGITVLAAAPVRAQLATSSADAGEASPFVAAHPTLQASLARIASRSALWREAAESIVRVGRRALVVTPEHVVVAAASDEPRRQAFDATVLAEVAPILRDDGYVDVVLVVVNLALLEEQHRGSQLPPIDFDRDLDRILVHEIYGHAVPYLLAGHVAARCADPQPRERPSDACSIRRENAVRAELRLGRRTDSGLEGLSLSRRNRD
jgi:hypothetical protein